MSVQVTVTLLIAHAIAAVLFLCLGGMWLAVLQPSLPIVPAAAGMLALGNAGMVGHYFTRLG